MTDEEKELIDRTIERYARTHRFFSVLGGYVIIERHTGHWATRIAATPNEAWLLFGKEVEENKG